MASHFSNPGVSTDPVRVLVQQPVLPGKPLKNASPIDVAFTQFGMAERPHFYRRHSLPEETGFTPPIEEGVPPKSYEATNGNLSQLAASAPPSPAAAKHGPDAFSRLAPPHPVARQPARDTKHPGIRPAGHAR